jgi:hypothetical protein
MITAAVAQRGYREEPVNRTRFAVELDIAFGPVTLGNGSKVNRNGFEWCAVFCSWAYWQATGTLLPIPDGGFYTPADVNAWRKLGRLVTSPQPGDLVYYARNGLPYHVGLVIAVNGAWYSSIEGNTSPSTVVDPAGGGVFQFGPYGGSIGDVPQRPVSGAFVFARPPFPLPPPISDEDDMTLYVTNGEPRTEGGLPYAPGAIIYAIEAGRLRNVGEAEWQAVQDKATKTQQSVVVTPVNNGRLDAMAKP